MTEIWAQAALWLGLALVATLVSIGLKVATALSEIVVGTIAQLIIGAALGGALLAGDPSWLKFLAGAGAIVLTFLAGAELDPVVFRRKWKEASAIGVVGFTAPFFVCAALAHWVLGWSGDASWLAGIAMSTTSVAVVYAVMLEFGFNVTDYGKTVLAACFINDLATVIALGFLFAPFSVKTLIFIGVSIVVFIVLPWVTPRFFRRFGGRPSELEAKFLMLCLFGMGALASWADSEAVLPAYMIGMVLAGTVGKDHVLVRRLRTLTFGLLTPFYFIRAGSLVSVPALVAAPAAMLIMLGGKMLAKILGVYPVTQLYGSPRREASYTTMLMSTGLTFGTISALFGLSHHVITQGQYSALVAAVILSAVVPTLIANAFFLPRHLLPETTAPTDDAPGSADGEPAPKESAMIRKILLGYDGSQSADRAYVFAADLSRRFEAELHVLAVARPPDFGDDVETEAVIENSRRHYDKVLGGLRVRLANEAVSAQVSLTVGHPAEQLVRYAEQHGIDHIVVGHRGHTLFDRWLIGSVARQVIAYAHCAVTVVRQ